MKLNRYFLFLGIIAMPYLAHSAVYDIDTNHSQVAFKIRHIVSKVAGHFDQFSGTIDFDAAKPASLNTEAVIQAASINTNVVKRDEHLRSADFFNAAKFPALTFKSKQVKDLGQGQLEITGDFTLLGVSKPVVLRATYGGEAKDPWGNTRAGFSAVGSINRKDFGMVWNQTLDSGGVLIGDTVELLIEIEAIKRK